MLKRWYKFSGYGQENNESNFGFINKLGVDWWCFHDRDIAPDGKTLEESNANLDEVVALAKKLQTAAKYEHRRENFFNELEIIFADVRLRTGVC